MTDCKRKKSHPLCCVDKAAGDDAFNKIVNLIVVVLAILIMAPTLSNAQGGPGVGLGIGTGIKAPQDTSGVKPEDSIQQSGSGSDGIIPMGNLINLIGEPDQSHTEDEGLQDGADETTYETPDYAEIYDLSPGQVESSIFTRRPRDPYYDEMIYTAPVPDISILGPLPEILEEGVEFTDMAADWIYHQKDGGLTELRGHVMIIYDTMIISCDEATLDEEKEMYRFFGEGRVFVDDADFTLECDELEIHDAENEKMMYISGQSTMVVYADEDAVEPGEDSTKRERVKYAFKQEDTTITFTDGEYNYDKDIFDGHNGVRFEQPGKYAQGDEFHGENETEYMLFTGNCEFWQEDGKWLYDYRIVEDKEDPPSRGDKITRALLSVASTITCDEAESKGDNGWLQMRSEGGNVVYFEQSDKHAECNLFTLWYTEEEEEQKEEEASDGIANLLEPEPVESDTEETFIKPPGFGDLWLASEFPPGYLPWDGDPYYNTAPVASFFLEPLLFGSQLDGTGSTEVPPPVEDGGEEGSIWDVIDRAEAESVLTQDQIAVLETLSSEQVQGLLEKGGLEFIKNMSSDQMRALAEQYSSMIESEADQETSDGSPVGSGPAAGSPFGVDVPSEMGQPEPQPEEPVIEEQVIEEPTIEERGDTEPEIPETSHGRIAELGDLAAEIGQSEEGAVSAGPRNEIIMEGNVFARQENGDWLFEYDIVDEEEEDEETIEQYKKWANASCDYLHAWTDKDLVEATGTVFGEQENQTLATDFLRFLGKLDMMYMKGHIEIHREGKHEVKSHEAFLFFTTKVFEALGKVRTMVTVDVDEKYGSGEEGTGEEGVGVPPDSETPGPETPGPGNNPPPD